MAHITSGFSVEYFASLKDAATPSETACVMECKNAFRHTDWWPKLERELGREYLEDLLCKVEAGRGNAYPPPECVFLALELTSCSDTRVVILGQDPYYKDGLAHGMCFSVPDEVRDLPDSLKTILNELAADGFGSAHARRGNLGAWAHQGVLLFNTALTVERGIAGSHLPMWSRFTEALVRIVTNERDPVFLLWGAKAQAWEGVIRKSGGSPDRILRSSHPAPPACYSPCGESPPFLGSRPFSRTNRLLGGDGIAW